MTATLGPTPATLSDRDLLASLDRVAAELERRWTSALAGGAFRDIDRYVTASHAVHRAQMALHDERPVWRARP